MRANGNYIYPAGPLAFAQVIAGSGPLVALSAVAVLGIGTLLRRSPVAILAGVVVFVLPAFTGPGVLGPGAGGALRPGSTRVTPAAGFSVLGLLPRSALVSFPYTMGNGYYPLPPWAGLLVLCALRGGRAWRGSRRAAPERRVTAALARGVDEAPHARRRRGG